MGPLLTMLLQSRDQVALFVGGKPCLFESPRLWVSVTPLKINHSCMGNCSLGHMVVVGAKCQPNHLSADPVVLPLTLGSWSLMKVLVKTLQRHYNNGC